MKKVTLTVKLSKLDDDLLATLASCKAIPAAERAPLSVEIGERYRAKRQVDSWADCRWSGKLGQIKRQAAERAAADRIEISATSTEAEVAERIFNAAPAMTPEALRRVLDACRQRIEAAGLDYADVDEAVGALYDWIQPIEVTS